MAVGARDMKLTQIEKLTFAAMARGRMPFKSQDSQWRLVQLVNNRSYRVVSTRTIESLIRKNLIIRNGDSFLITRNASKFLVPIEYKVDWKKLEGATP